MCRSKNYWKRAVAGWEFKSPLLLHVGNAQSRKICCAPPLLPWWLLYFQSGFCKPGSSLNRCSLLICYCSHASVQQTKDNNNAYLDKNMSSAFTTLRALWNEVQKEKRVPHQSMASIHWLAEIEPYRFPAITLTSKISKNAVDSTNLYEHRVYFKALHKNLQLEYSLHVCL